MMNNKNNNIKAMRGMLRGGICLFMLSGSCVLSAQTVADGSATDSVAPVTVRKATVPKYEMKEISGRVYDAATKQPLGGIRVQALNNRLYSAITDDDGSYTIKVPVFVNSLYIASEESDSKYNGVQVALKADKGQDAYLYSNSLKSFYTDGTQLFASSKLKLNTTSAVTVENEMENGLNGAVRTISRGGMPAQGAALFMNGITSLNTNAQPLIEVDGVIWDMQYDRTTLHDGFFNNVFNLIDPEDIDNVEVLNNGTAIYGARGANGVIKITTKRGKSLATRINVRAYGAYELSPSTTSMMDANQYRSYVSEFLGTTAMVAEGTLSPTYVPEFLNEDKAFLYYNVYHNNTDWQKDLYRNSFTQNYKVSVEGGDDIAKYNLSLGYTKADATAKTNDFNRLNIRFNTDIAMFRNFTSELDIFYTRNAYNLRDNGWAEDYTSRNISSPNVLGLIQAPFISPYTYYVRYDDGLKLGYTELIYSGKNYNDANNPYSFASTYGYSGFANPYWILLNGQGDNKNYQEQTQFSINFAPKYQINKYLSVTNRFSYIITRSNEKYYLPYEGTPVKTVPGIGDVSSVVASQFGKETTLFDNLYVRWNRSFGSHNVNVIGGFRFASYTYTDSKIQAYNNTNDKMPNIGMGLMYKTQTGNSDNWTNLAYYLNGDYNFQNKYFLNVGATMEASSRFGKEANEGLKLFNVRWGVFPSVQAAWLISSEDWFNVPFVNYLKLTAGYDETGNDNVDYYAVRTYFANKKFFDVATGLVLDNIQNPKLQWETTRRVNVGLQTSVLNNALTLGVNFYHSKTDNLLVRKSVSDITGLPSMWTNDGALKNTGVEGSLNAVIVNTKNFKWQAGFTIGHYKNEITELPETNLNRIKTYVLDENGQKDYSTEHIIHGYTSSIYGKNNILTAVGSAAGVFYGYKTAGVFSTDAEAANAGKYGYLRYPTGLRQNPYRNFQAGDVHFIDQNGDGWISEADMVEIGDPNPDIYGNFYTNLSWKDLTLDVVFKYSLGNDVYNYQRSQLESVNGIYNQTTAAVNRWRYQGQVTEVPRAMSPDNDNWVNNERFSDRWIEDGSYLKIKKIRLSYKVPFTTSWLLGLSVWGEANNVATVTKYLGNDPEVSAGNGVLYQGIDAGYLPQSRNFNLGVTINL